MADDYRSKLERFFGLVPKSAAATLINKVSGAEYYGEVAAGTPVMLLNGAANRDPGRFECPAEFRADRRNTMDHIAFGRGHHSCPGGPLARAEGRISIERILDKGHGIADQIKAFRIERLPGQFRRLPVARRDVGSAHAHFQLVAGRNQLQFGAGRRQSHRSAQLLHIADRLAIDGRDDVADLEFVRRRRIGDCVFAFATKE